MPEGKAPEGMRSEAYCDVRRSDECGGKRSRRAFFNSLNKKGRSP